MRKIALLAIAILLFSTLAFLSVQTTLPWVRDTGPSTDLAESKPESSKQDQFVLRLDHSLSIPAGTTLAKAPRTNPVFAKLTEPGNRRSLWFLAAAMVLGLLTGLILRKNKVPSGLPEQLPGKITPDTATDDRGTEGDATDTFYDSGESGMDASLQIALREEIQALRDNLESYDVELQQAESRIKDHEVTIEELRNESKTADVLSGQLNQTLQQHQILGEELAERDETIGNLHADIDSWQEQTITQEKLSAELTASIEELRTEKSRLENDYKASEDLINELQTSNTDLTNHIDQLGQTEKLADELTRQLTDEEQNNNSLRAEIDELQNQIQSLESKLSEFDDVSTTLISTKDDFHAIDNSAREVETQLETLMSELRLLSDQHNDAEKHIEQMDSSLGSLADDITTLQDRHNQDSGHYQEEIRSLSLAHTGEISTKKLEVTTLHEQLEQDKEHYEEQIAGLKLLREDDQNEKDIQVKELETEIEEKTAALESLEVELSSERQGLEEINARLEQEISDKSALEKEHSNLMAVLEETEQNNNELSDSVMLLREDLVDMANKINEKNQAISDWQQQLAVEKHHATAREEKITTLEQELELEHKELSTMMEKIDAADEIENRLSIWDNTVQTYRRDVADKNSLIDTLRDQLMVSNKGTEVFKDQIRDMDNHIENLTFVQEELATVSAIQKEVDEVVRVQDSLLQDISGEQASQSEKLETAFSQIAEFETATRLWNDEIEELSQSTETLQEQLTNRSLELDQSNNHAQELQSDLSDQSLILEKLQNIISQSHSSFAPIIEKTASETDDKQDALIIQATDLLTLLDTNSNNLAILTDENQNILSELNTQKSLCDEQSKKIKTIEQEISRQHELLANNKTEFEQLGQSNQLLETDMEADKQKVQELTAALDQLQKDHLHQVTEFKEQRSALSSKFESANSQLSGELSEQKEANKQLRATVNQLRDELKQRIPLSQPFPVLQKKVSGGAKNSDIPVLGKAVKKTASSDDGAD